MDTTRRYPRTQAEAFKDCSYGAACQHFPGPWYRRPWAVLLRTVLLCVAAFLLGLLLIGPWLRGAL